MIRSTMRPIWLGLALLGLHAALPPSAAAQDPGGWTAYWENDSFVLFGGSDQSYTNGVRLVWDGRPNPRRTFRGELERSWGRIAWVGDAWQTTSSWTLGQTFFTPSTITDYEVDPTDRPFAGIAYGGLRLDATELVAPGAAVTDRVPGFGLTRHMSVEANVGLLGAAAGAELFQTFAHVLRENRVPKGWMHQLPQEPYVSLNGLWRIRAGWSFLDVTPHGGLLASTVQSYPYAGVTFRVGWNLSDFPALLVRPTAAPVSPRADWEVALVTGVEGRALAHNAFVQGGLRSDSRGVPAEHLVGDWRVGFSVRLTDWRLTWTQVRRSPEMADETVPFRRYHDYGSVSLAYEPGTRTAAARQGTPLGFVVDRMLTPVLGRMVLEAGTGPADSGGALGALGSRVGLSFRLCCDRWAVGGEVVGLARELGPPAAPGGDHEDIFLVNKLLTVRMSPLGRRGPGRLQLKAGVGQGVRKLQITPGEPGPRPLSSPCPVGTELETADLRYCNATDTGLGWMLGAGYWFAMPGDKASLGVDYAWNSIRLDGPLGPSDFATLTFGVQWHP